MKTICLVIVSFSLLFPFLANSTRYTCDTENGFITYDMSELLPLVIKDSKQTNSYKEVEVTSVSASMEQIISVTIEQSPYKKTLSWVIPYFTQHPTLNLYFGSLLYETTYTVDKIVQHEIRTLPLTNCRITK